MGHTIPAIKRSVAPAFFSLDFLMFIDIFTTPKTTNSKQHFEITALLLKNIRLSELYEIASLSSEYDLHKKFIANEKNRSEGLRKLINAHLPALQFDPSELSLRYELIIKLAKKVRTAIQKKMLSLSKIENVVILYELTKKNKIKLMLSTLDLLYIEEIGELVNYLVQNLTVGLVIKYLSFKAVDIDYFNNNFQKYINLSNHENYESILIKYGVSYFDQCQAKISYELKTRGNSELLHSLNSQYKNFKVFEKLLEKTLDSRNPDIRSESIVYIKNLGFEINNSYFTANLYVHPQRAEVVKKLRSFIKNAQRKKARKKNSNENYRLTVYVTKGILEFLGTSPNPRKSKAEILRFLVDDFLNAKAKDQSRFLKTAVISDKTKHSHQKTDFTIPKKTYEHLTKTAKNNNITIQDLINVLTRYALSQNPFFLVLQQTEIINTSMVTQEAKISIASYEHSPTFTSTIDPSVLDLV